MIIEDHVYLVKKAKTEKHTLLLSWCPSGHRDADPIYDNETELKLALSIQRSHFSFILPSALRKKRAQENFCVRKWKMLWNFLWIERYLSNPWLTSRWSIWTSGECESVSRSVVSDSLQPHGLYIAYQVPWSMEFSRQEYWTGLPFLSPEDLPNPGIKGIWRQILALKADSFIFLRAQNTLFT